MPLRVRLPEVCLRLLGGGLSGSAGNNRSLMADSCRSVVGGVSRADVEAAFPGWEMRSVEAAETSGLGWPLTKTAPQWYRLHQPI